MSYPAVKVFLDSNNPMYVAGAEHPNRAPALRILERAVAGELEALTNTEVPQEILYRYSSLKRRDLAFEVHGRMSEICAVILSVALADTDRARQLLQQIPTLGVRDAIHAAVMFHHGIETLASFDDGFDAVPGIRRLRGDQPPSTRPTPPTQKGAILCVC